MKIELRLPFCTCGRDTKTVSRNVLLEGSSGSRRNSAMASEGGTYGGGSSSRCSRVAVLLGLIGLPREQMLGPFLTRYRQNGLRIVVLLFFFAILGWLTSWPKALVLSVDVLALLELR